MNPESSRLREEILMRLKAQYDGSGREGGRCQWR